MVVANIVLCINSLIGYLCNGILIYLVQRNPNSRMGTYRYLILVLAVFNIVYATAHLLVIPVFRLFLSTNPLLLTILTIHSMQNKIARRMIPKLTQNVTYVHDYGFCFYSSSFLGGYKIIGYMALIGYCSLFAQSTILLAYHFIYRYACICKTEWLDLINTKKAIFALSFYYFAYFALWITMVHLYIGPTEEFFHRIDVGFYRFAGLWPNETAIIGDNYFINENGNLRFNLRPWICLTVCMTQMSAMFCVILYCGWSMHRKLSSSEMASERGYRLQKQLFQALLIQFIVPIILEYIPCTAIFLVPMLGEEVNLEWATMGISLYPVFEPIVVIYFVREYRLGLSAMIFGKKRKTAISHTSEVVTQHSHSDSNLKDSKSTQQIANDKMSTMRKN